MAVNVLARLGPFCTASMKVLTAAKEASDEDTNMHTVCIGTKEVSHPAVRVRQKYKCPYVQIVDDKPVPCTVEHSSYHPFPRGQENADGTFTVLTSDDLATAAVDKDVTDTLTLFRCPKAQADEYGVPDGKFYWLGVGAGTGKENYGLIRDIIRDTSDKWVWFTEWAYRTAPHLVRVVLMGDVLGLQQLAWPAQVQQKPNVDVPAYDPRWYDLAMQAAEIVTVDFDPATFTDTRKAKIAEMLAATAPAAGGGEGAAPAPVAADAAMVEMAAWVKAQKAKTVGAKGDTARKPRAKKVTEAPPVQPLPDEVPDNVTVVPKKRAPRKTAVAKKTA